MTPDRVFRRISSQKSGDRIIINTVIIYAQRVSSALLSLITTPVVLNALGVEDYGLYTLTVGLVGMIAFINWSLSSATQRFLAFSIGEGDREKLNRVFTSSLLIHGLYALILLILIISLGGLFVDKLLTIPEARMNTAKVVIKFVACITFIQIISVPYIGLFRSHENFLYLAITGIIESAFKLGSAFLILIVEIDRLIAYSSFLLAIATLIFFFNIFFSRRFYPEVRFKLKSFNRALVIEMIYFTGWSLMGATAIMSRNQGVLVLLNIFFGVVANAAYGIAMQVNSAISILSQGIIGSITPQLMKSAGSGEFDKMVYLMRTMSKFAVLSVSIIAIPFLLEAPLVLKLWLKNVPEGAVLFSRLIIVFGLIMGLSAGINSVFTAIGRVKVYNIYISSILILNLPFAYYLFKIGSPAYTIILTGIFLEIVSLFIRLLLLRKYVDFSLNQYIKDVIFRISAPIMITSAVIVLLKLLSINAFIQLVISFVIFITVYPFIVYKFSFDKKQKLYAIQAIVKTKYFFIQLRRSV